MNLKTKRLHKLDRAIRDLYKENTAATRNIASLLSIKYFKLKYLEKAVTVTSCDPEVLRIMKDCGFSVTKAFTDFDGLVVYDVRIFSEEEIKNGECL